MPKQFIYEVLRILHGHFGKHPKMTTTKIAYRQKYHYPNMAQLIRKLAMSCEHCVKESRIDNRFTRQPLQNPSEDTKDQKTPCRLNCLWNCLHQVAIKTFLQLWMCSPYTYLPSLNRTKMLEQSPEAYSTSLPSMHTCRQRWNLTGEKPSYPRWWKKQPKFEESLWKTRRRLRWSKEHMPHWQKHWKLEQVNKG